MQSKRQLALFVALLIAAISVGRAQAQDYPTYGGSDVRNGQNNNPLNNGPGPGYLRWFAPGSILNTGTTVIRHCTATSPNVLFTAGWIAPTDPIIANNTYVPLPTGNAALDLIEGVNPTPPYRYAFTVPSSTTDATKGVGGIQDTFTYKLDPANGVAGNYSAYFWLPIGPTSIGGKLFYTQRFWVVEVDDSLGQRFVDIVDTFVAGTGFVRIGNGGLPTNQLFVYDGVNPIVMKVYNTVPRDANGTLLDVPGQTLVYADAAIAVPDLGSYAATPTLFATGPNPADIRVASALNATSVGFQNGRPVTSVNGTVTSREFDNGTAKWTHSPLNEALGINVDNISANVKVTGSFVSNTAAANYLGLDYLNAVIVNSLPLASTVTYAPPLEDGDYFVYAWLPGNSNGQLFGTQVRYEIHEGATITPVTIDQSVGGGWVKIGTRRFAHVGATFPLSVVVTNFSANPADLGKLSYADQIRFVGAGNLAITSSPVQASALINVPGTGPVQKNVVIVATENGKISCLDAAGRADGTTDVYWTYPSTPDTDNPNWKDPNLQGDDGVNNALSAEMPIGFDLSTAVVQNVAGTDYLYIGSRNGRIYSIEMTGRGDGDLGKRKPGTTRRHWSFPDDFPAIAVPSNLGGFHGSLAYAVTAAGPTIFAGSQQGRMYALDAVGKPNKTTTTRWIYPALNKPNLGPIEMTPTVDFGSVFFGTITPDGNTKGAFYSLNAQTGALIWTFQGANFNGNFVPSGDYLGCAATGTAAQLGNGMPDSIFVHSANGYVYGFNAANGQILWASNELGVGGEGGLTLNFMSVFDNSGILNPNVLVPVVMVPTGDGRFDAMFADAASQNVFGGHLAWEYVSAGQSIVSSMSVGRKWLYGADSGGYIYAFNTVNSQITPGTAPGSQTIVPNNPQAQAFRDAKIEFLTHAAYLALRAGPQDYSFAKNVANLNPQGDFEWGQTIYALAYDFPAGTGNTFTLADFLFNFDGTVSRTSSVQAQTWGSGSPDNNHNGYAVIAYTVQGAGSAALPPGKGTAQVQLSTAALNGSVQRIAMNPAFSQRTVTIANPIAIVVQLDGNGNPILNQSVGLEVDPANQGFNQNVDNGNVDVNAGPNYNMLESLLATATGPGGVMGPVSHGQTALAEVFIYDRSLMTLIRGPGRGLDNVRAQLSDLAWQGASVNMTGGVIKPLPPFYVNFEDYPVHFPNDSLDYPDIRRDRIKVTKSLNEDAQNPTFNGVELNAPTGPGGAQVTENNALKRILVPTPFDWEVDVPLFQPPNLSMQRGAPNPPQFNLPGGYFGQMYVFVDSEGTGQLKRNTGNAVEYLLNTSGGGSTTGTIQYAFGGTTGNRDAFRTFFLGTSVSVDERLAVKQPNVDLGSLAGGTGYSPLAPFDPGSPFSPWNNNFSGMFKPFTVENLGNVNELNVRFAHDSNVGNAFTPWAIFASANDDQAWVDPEWQGWSDLDPQFSLTKLQGLDPLGKNINQKGRVGDRFAPTMATNPVRRSNAGLGVLSGPLFANFPVQDPRIAITLPPGFPVGQYVQKMRIIEDDNNDLSLAQDANGNALESYSDPSFDLSFLVRETRLTTSFTRFTAPMMEDFLAGGVQPTFGFANVQPAGLRGPNGDLIVAFSSNRGQFNPLNPADDTSNTQYRIFIGTLLGKSQVNQAGKSPLRDLNGATPDVANGRLFHHSIDAFPNTAPDLLFSSAGADTVIPTSVRFGNPTFPNQGFLNPYNQGAMFGDVLMAFTGSADKQTATGHSSESRIFVSLLTTGSGTVGLSPPASMPNDVNVPKSRPSILQINDNQGVVFYSTNGTGQSQLFYSLFDANGTPKFSESTPIPVGSGFQSAAEPSVLGRVYQRGQAGQADVIEMTFTGKLRGRQSDDVYFCRLSTSQSGAPADMLYLPGQIRERLVQQGEPGTFRTRGVSWNAAATFSEAIDGTGPFVNRVLLQEWHDLNGNGQIDAGELTDIEVSNTRATDRTTGIISFDTTLGGKAYIDPFLGTVRLSASVPLASSELVISYQPKYLRVSEGSAPGFNLSNIMFDSRLITNYSYWFRKGDTVALVTDPLRNDRFVLTYDRSAGGAGQTARPYMQTMRLGVELPSAVATTSGGNVAAIKVTGNLGPYQVDPAGKRVYFTAIDEASVVTVTYTGADEADGRLIPGIVVTNPVGLVTERGEAPIPIEESVNESGMYPFMDPFDSGTLSDRRGLIWMLWSSTRGGISDVYLQSISPKLVPVAKGN